MSTLAKMVPQVMLFQKIVSNLGALFSMQTPLGSWTKVGLNFLVPAHPGSPGQRAIKWMLLLINNMTTCMAVLPAGYFKSFEQ